MTDAKPVKKRRPRQVSLSPVKKRASIGEDVEVTPLGGKRVLAPSASIERESPTQKRTQTAPMPTPVRLSMRPPRQDESDNKEEITELLERKGGMRDIHITDKEELRNSNGAYATMYYFTTPEDKKSACFISKAQNGELRLFLPILAVEGPAELQVPGLKGLFKTVGGGTVMYPSSFDGVPLVVYAYMKHNKAVLAKGLGCATYRDVFHLENRTRTVYDSSHVTLSCCADRLVVAEKKSALQRIRKTSKTHLVSRRGTRCEWPST